VIDALLFAVRDAVRGAGFGYGIRECEIMPDGHPQPRCGNVFVSVYQGAYRSTMDNALNEYYGWNLTLTMRVNVPWDRIGDQLLAQKLARKIGFNARCAVLRGFLHMNWSLLQPANQYLLDVNPDATLVYGFSEPARFRSGDVPVLVGGEWFAAEPEATDVGLKAELRFEDCRRGPQAIASYT
jgi:hypothetical protein